MTEQAGGKLTTHVLDTAGGCPGAGIQVQLYYLDGNRDGDSEHCLTHMVTNSDGRTDSPLLTAENMVPGVYELRFWVGDYFAAKELVSKEIFLPQVPFLDLIPIRFGIADATAHYHVPLLVSPWSYSTYRGS
ncbi:MAG: hydroxyisourate hydrolase [Cyanobacteria bacterium P01_H01_bin.105]